MGEESEAGSFGLTKDVKSSILEIEKSPARGHEPPPGGGFFLFVFDWENRHKIFSICT